MAKSEKTTDRESAGRQFFQLAYHALQAATDVAPKVGFIQRLLVLLTKNTDCDAGILLGNGENYIATMPHGSGDNVPVFRWNKPDAPASEPEPSLPWDRIVEKVIGVKGIHSTDGGGFWTNNVRLLTEHCPDFEILGRHYRGTRHERRSFALITFTSEKDLSGAIQLMGAGSHIFTPEMVALYEDVTMIIGIAFQVWRNAWTLQERIKEMSCLYGLAQVFDSPEKDMPDILKETLELIPPAWLYADIARARIVFDEQCYASSGFREGGPMLTADILIHGERRGAIDVTYAKEKPDLDEGPFLKEERKLLDAIAKELSVIIERKLYEAEKVEMMDRLRQADRLSMVGRLAASVAHEVNEPLTSILGFAQLLEKNPNLPAQAASDVDKIVRVSLHAREIVRKLLMFTHKMPSRESEVSVNQVILEALGFFEYRCAKDKIELHTDLESDLPDIPSDPGQLRQVVVNLVVNAMQAMPRGGRLTTRTFQSDRYVELTVEDTGLGMDKETLDKIFIPFYTTKPAGMGTGLGLPVAQDIVTDHGGEIRVTSSPKSGTRIHVRLPKAPA